MIHMILSLLSPSGITFYSLLPISITQLDLLITIKSHIDMGWEVVEIFDYSTLDNDQIMEIMG